jgi:hypothetical protein
MPGHGSHRAATSSSRRWETPQNLQNTRALGLVAGVALGMSYMLHTRNGVATKKRHARSEIVWRGASAYRPRLVLCDPFGELNPAASSVALTRRPFRFGAPGRCCGHSGILPKSVERSGALPRSRMSQSSSTPSASATCDAPARLRVLLVHELVQLALTEEVRPLCEPVERQWRTVRLALPHAVKGHPSALPVAAVPVHSGKFCAHSAGLVS